MKKFILIILLILVSLFSVSAAQIVCAPMTNGEINPGTVGKKFNPGHYIVVTGGMNSRNQAERETNIRSVILPKKDEIKGAQPMITWKELEPTEGNYDFSSIRETLDLLTENDLHMVLYLQDRRFGPNGCEWGAQIPQYMVDRGYAYIDVKGNCMPKMWDPEYMSAYIRLYNAIGEEFDDHPNFEMIIHGETTLGRPEGGNYPMQQYKDQLIRLLTETTSLEKTPVAMKTNFLDIGNPSTMLSIIEDGIIANKQAMSWPDPFPNNGATHPQRYSLENPGVLLMAPQANTAVLRPGDTQKVLDSFVDEHGASHIFWNSWFFNKFGDKVPNYYEGELLTTLRANDFKISTTCPSSIGTCLDTSNSCNAVVYNMNSHQSSSQCYRKNPGDNIDLGFGAPFDTDTNRLFMSGTCSANSINLDIENSDITYIYENGYYWDGSKWEGFKLNGQNVDNSPWISSDADYSINGIDTSQNTFVLTYACKWTGSKWKCGCRDQACTQSFWNMQVFRR